MKLLSPRTEHCNFTDTSPIDPYFLEKRRRCSECRNTDTFNLVSKKTRKKTPMWYFAWDSNSILCDRCYSFYGNRTIKWRSWRKEYNRRHISFYGKSVIMDRNYKSGKCSECKQSKLTGIYKLERNQSHPLDHWRELCLSCANKLRLCGRGSSGNMFGKP